MKKHRIPFLGLVFLALSAAFLMPQRAAADDDDPPSRVARLSYTRGTVSFNPAGTDDWVNAVVNRPMTTGDKLWNDNGARSELSIGSATIRLGGNTGFSFLNLTDNITQLRLTEGTLNIRVRSLDTDETFEVDTPNLAFSILRTGSYKINVNEAGDATIVVVRNGEAEVTGGGQAFTIRPGEIGEFNGIDELSADVQRWDRDDDDFDHWCSDRDRRIDHSISSRYVSSDAIGYEDLDDYGGWRPVPEYGNVWFPHTTVVGWAPYHYGHWVWISPWGYTWVDDEPWGFAPFHYGRWVTVGGAWGWVPCAPRPVAVVGVAYVRPVYAPALVAWVGGPHFAVGIGIGGGGGGVAWFPLGPREVYVPSYHVSRTYVTNVNVTNTTVNNTVVNNYYNNTVVNKTVNVTNVTYVNQSVPGAVTATSHQAFTSAQPVAKNVIVVNAKEVASAPVVVTTPAVAPSKQATLGAGAIVAAKPPVAFQNRAVVAKVAPPPPPVSFVKQQEAVQANGGRPMPMSQVRQIQPQVAQAPHPEVKIAPPSRVMPTQNVQANHAGAPPPAPANQPNATIARQPNQSNRPPAALNNSATPSQSVPPNPANRPSVTNTSVETNQGNRPAAALPNNASQKSYSDRPPTARPATVSNSPASNPQLDQKHQQQVEQLHSKQDQERQRMEQQQQQERQKLAQKAADDQRQQQLNQKHEQQLQQLEQKHEAAQQKLQDRQQQERQRQQEKPAKQEKPAPAKQERTQQKP